MANQLKVCSLDHTRPSIKAYRNNVERFLDYTPKEPEDILSEDNIKNILFLAGKDVFVF